MKNSPFSGKTATSPCVVTHGSRYRSQRRQVRFKAAHQHHVLKTPDQSVMQYLDHRQQKDRHCQAAEKSRSERAMQHAAMLKQYARVQVLANANVATIRLLRPAAREPDEHTSECRSPRAPQRRGHLSHKEKIYVAVTSTHATLYVNTNTISANMEIYRTLVLIRVRKHLHPAQIKQFHIPLFVVNSMSK